MTEAVSFAPHVLALYSLATTKEDAEEAILLRIIFAEKYGWRDTKNIPWWVKVFGKQWGLNYSKAKWRQLVNEKQDTLKTTLVP